MADNDDTIDKTETPVVKRRGTSLSTPLLGIIMGVVGTVLMYFGFVNGISAALDGTSGNFGGYLAAFLVGVIFVLTAIVLGLVGLVRGGHRFLSFLSLLVGLVPAAIIGAIYVANHV